MLFCFFNLLSIIDNKICSKDSLCKEESKEYLNLPSITFKVSKAFLLIFLLESSSSRKADNLASSKVYLSVLVFKVAPILFKIVFFSKVTKSSIALAIVLSK